MYIHKHKVQFYETDLMGIVHHSNYLRFCEEARVDWANHQGILDYQKPESAAYFAVLETQVRHIKPAKFGDDLVVQVQAKIEKVKFIFEYKIFHGSNLLCEARTLHVSLDKNLKLVKPPQEIRKTMENSPWTETWLSSL